LLGGG
jgi:hypothetical protein